MIQATEISWSGATHLLFYHRWLTGSGLGTGKCTLWDLRNTRFAPPANAERTDNTWKQD
jgi:hypothetical protein